MRKNITKYRNVLVIILRIPRTSFAEAISQLLANVFMPLRSLSPLYFPKYRILPSIAIIIVVVVVVSTCAAPLKNAEDTRYFRRTREETPFSSTVSSSCSNRRRRRRLLRLSIEAFRTWTGYMVDFPGVLRLRHRVATTNSSEPSPFTRPFASLDRARNVLATRFCLKREFHSRIRKTHSSCVRLS